MKNVVRQDGNIKKIVPLTHFKHALNVDLVHQGCTKIIVRNLNRLAHAKNVADQKDDTKKHALSSKNKNVQNVAVYRAPTTKTVLMQKDQNVLNAEEPRKVTKKHVHNMYLEKNVQNAVVAISAPTRKHVHIMFRTKVFVTNVAHQNQHINEDVLNTNQSSYVKNAINVMAITLRPAHTTIYNSKRSGVQAVNDGKWSEIKERVRHKKNLTHTFNDITRQSYID